uniref:Uncharacterized protein n=1 Tax=Nothobranchius furzeri TaxID=105023 RepID=A0A8C6K792_NOTFU
MVTELIRIWFINYTHEIISLHKKGEGYKISKALHYGLNTGAKVTQKFKKDGSATILQRRPDHPHKLTSRLEHLLMRRVENHHARSLQLAKVHTLAFMGIVQEGSLSENFILWSDETKIIVFGTNGFKTVQRRKGEDFKEKCMVPTVKHGGGSVIMWDCMSASLWTHGCSRIKEIK